MEGEEESDFTYYNNNNNNYQICPYDFNLYLYIYIYKLNKKLIERVLKSLACVGIITLLAI